MTINVDKIREELRALWGQKTGLKACPGSAEYDPEEEHLRVIALTLGARFRFPAEYGGGEGSIPWDVDEDEWVYLQEALLAEYCGLTEEEAS